jgi:hypothetical protein
MADTRIRIIPFNMRYGPNPTVTKNLLEDLN